MFFHQINQQGVFVLAETHATLYFVISYVFLNYVVVSIFSICYRSAVKKILLNSWCDPLFQTTLGIAVSCCCVSSHGCVTNSSQVPSQVVIAMQVVRWLHMYKHITQLYIFDKQFQVSHDNIKLLTIRYRAATDWCTVIKFNWKYCSLLGSSLKNVEIELTSSVMVSKIEKRTYPMETQGIKLQKV